MANETKFPNGVNLQGNKAVSAADGVDPTDLITKQQLDGAATQGPRGARMWVGTVHPNSFTFPSPIIDGDVYLDANTGDVYELTP